MTFGKCFISWMKEAGRGHLCAFAGWGTLLLYGVLTITRLSFDTDYNYFGIGSAELKWVCAGLGLFLAFLEFFYLLWQKKQDFYYSLPVRKSMIFWSRYAHGLVHFLVPFILVMAVCGIYQTSVDMEFAPFVGSYTAKSMLVFAGVFLIFYHIGILCVTVCGNVISAVPVCAAWILYFPVLIKTAVTMFCENYFATYYKITLLEKLNNIFSPFHLSAYISGGDVFEKPLVLRFSPSALSVAAALVWIVLLFVLAAMAAGKRKAERTGRIFALSTAERVCEIGFSLLAGIWAAGFAIDASGMAKNSPLMAGLLGAAVSIAAVCAVHFLLEGLTKNPAAKLLRRKWQLAAVCAAAAAAGAAFPAGASAYDGYLPDPEKVAAVSISLDGIDMDYDAYVEVSRKGECYEAEKQMQRYTLTAEGRSAAMGWLGMVVEQQASSRQGLSEKEAPEVYTYADVCYQTGDGGNHYRTYALSREAAEAFAAVYETDEYRQLAYPAVGLENVSEDRFTWDDSASSSDLKMTADEKEALIAAYREDVAELEMSELGMALPMGRMKIKSSETGNTTEMTVYPFFEQTCSLLEKCGVETGKMLADYPVKSVEVTETLFPTPAGSSGRVKREYYDRPEDVEEWKQKLAPYDFDVQPLLYPLDHTKDIRIEVEDTETNSTSYLSCVVVPDA